MNYKLLEVAFAVVRKQFSGAKPVCGLILGSGWSEAAGFFKVKDQIAYADIPGMGKATVPGHSGRLVWGEFAGLETFIFQGRRHWYEGEGWEPVALPVYLLRKFGASIVVLTNAAGGIRKDLKPGSLMLIDDHINAMQSNPLIGPHNPLWGARFPDQAQVYDPILKKLLKKAATKNKISLAQGIYLAVSGPTYETPAEISALRTLGADAVGMSTVPEAMLANAAALRVVGLSCITNAAKGGKHGAVTHRQVTGVVEKAIPSLRLLLQTFWREIAAAGLIRQQ